MSESRHSANLQRSRQWSYSAAKLIFSLALFLCVGCTALFSGVFHQDDPTLFVSVAPLYRLPLVGFRQTFLLVQGIGGQFSHRGEVTWAFDWAMPTRTVIVCAREGVVASVRSEHNDRELPLEKRQANFVRIRHEDGSVGVYAHLDTTSIHVGTIVRAGDAIGLSGNTGYSTQPHLHFHVEQNGQSIPISFIDVKDEGGIPRVGRLYRGSWPR